jgi:hypothetical protein
MVEEVGARDLSAMDATLRGAWNVGAATRISQVKNKVMIIILHRKYVLESRIGEGQAACTIILSYILAKLIVRKKDCWIPHWARSS